MKKVIKLKESDLMRIVNRVIKEQQGLETQRFTDKSGRTYSFPGIRSEDDLQKLLDWSNGQFSESIISKLTELGLKGVVELNRVASQLKSSGGAEGMTQSGNSVSLMNSVIRELLRLMAMKGLTTKNQGLETSLTSSFMSVNYIPRPEKEFLSSITKTYPNFWEVFKKIAQQKLG